MKCMCVFYFAVVIVQSVHERSIMLLQWQEMYKYTTCTGFMFWLIPAGDYLKTLLKLKYLFLKSFLGLNEIYVWLLFPYLP